MINWEELKHIHVIRKLEEILGQWFSTDVFFVDDKGQIKNYDPADKTRIYRNPICSYLFGSEQGKELVLKTIANSYEKAVKSDKTHFFLEGPLGVENILVSRIIVENDCLGHVFAYCFVDKEVSQELKLKAKAYLENLNISSDGFFQNVHKLKILTPAEKKYLLELVDLVAQEIVTFHTEISKREEKINALNTQLGIRYSYHSMIGKAKPMQDLYTMLDKLKNSESTVLIQGENGTGKELIAKAIHFNSSRKDNQFVTVNCSAFNENLLDSELFGHVKGSFTGAIRDKKGL
ncbi:MAG: sigma 54-interacting transcriptional regulator, partial [Bdellovibrio sp.]|nr:sigma 54-interacting transcriptional regulator [Bdellovibrio sp.]